MTPMEKIRAAEKSQQYVKDATSRFQGACDRLSGNAGERWVGFTTEYFMYQVVSRLLEIVELLPDHEDEDDAYMQEDIRRDVQQLHSTLRSRNIAKKLERTNGRTPEEQATFAAKAAELRG